MNRTLQCDLHAPAAARKMVSEFLGEPAIPTEILDDVLLAVSELVTNAVEAGATSIELRVDVSQSEIRMSVDDDTGGWPTLSPPKPYATRGRGLSIVAEAATRWDVERTRDGKKVTAYFTIKSHSA